MQDDPTPVYHGPDHHKPDRHPYGPRPIGQLLPAVTRPAFKRRSPAAARITTDWREIVGPALAAATIPRRLSGTTLVIACAGPVALELQHLAAELAARINAHLGRIAVTRFRFLQDAVLPPPPPAPAPPPREAPPLPLPGVAPGALYDALQALGRAVRQTHDPELP